MLERYYNDENNKLVKSNSKDYVEMLFKEKYKYVHLLKILSDKISIVYSYNKNQCVRSDDILKLLSKTDLCIYRSEYIPSGV